ncbi:MAG: accessory factor UbiK family protein [Alphaproteobacteria bacterium]|nr:accessory factor UbiK family protein [Alphaproteobacteria bacterium]MBF0250003.1 accessory factor UbiK family protein [Alphaproteobacteria bacterium]
MQTSNSLLDDLARVASGAASAVTGLKGDADSLLRRQLERLLADMNLVTREEFDAVKAMAAKARAEQERLEARVAELETQLNAKG